MCWFMETSWEMDASQGPGQCQVYRIAPWMPSVSQAKQATPTLKQIPVGPWSPQAKSSLNMELTRLTLSCNYTGSRALGAQAGTHACSLSA